MIMDKYEVLAEYKKARKARDDATTAVRAAEKARGEAEKAFSDIYSRAVQAVTGSECVAFEGEIWFKDDMGRIHSRKLG